MFKTLFPTRDTTLYSRHPERNTGADQILELTKVASGSAIEDVIGSHEYWDTNFNTRFLIDFDLAEVSASISSGDIVNPTFYLTVKATEAIHLPISYTLYAYPVSGSWVNGTGYYNNDVEVQNGATWIYRNGAGDGTQWSVAGGDFYSASVYENSQTFNYEQPDMRMDVTSIVNAWISGSIPQNGIIVKHHTTVENDGTELGSIKFFSKDTHTIYIPRLEIFWDDVDVSGTGSVSEISGEDYIVYTNNLKESYFEGETPKIRIGVRDRFPIKSYSTTNAYLTTSRLPFDSHFQVMDSRTDEVIIPFDDVGTRVSCDASGNYIRLDIDSFLPERYYKVMIRVTTDGGSTVNYVDDGFWFKVKRK
jgi:hypothetical protein